MPLAQCSFAFSAFVSTHLVVAVALLLPRDEPDSSKAREKIDSLKPT